MQNISREQKKNLECLSVNSKECIEVK